MKKKYLIGLIVVVVIFSPVLVSISVALFALLALTLAVYSVFCLVAMTMKAIAISTAGRHYQLLAKLGQAGLPPSEREAEDMSESGCSNPNHASECTPSTCWFKQAEESWRLIYACEQEQVPGWRVRWVTL